MNVPTHTKVWQKYVKVMASAVQPLGVNAMTPGLVWCVTMLIKILVTLFCNPIKNHRLSQTAPDEIYSFCKLLFMMM